MEAPPRNLTMDEWKAEMAFQVLCILRRAHRDDPLLMHNCYFDALLEEVQSDFNTAFLRATS